MTEKAKMAQFTLWVSTVRADDPKTWVAGTVMKKKLALDTMDGTSMAAPHVSGAAAMMMARNAELIGKPQRIKQILCDSTVDLGRERYFQGHGLLDILRALQSV